MNRRLCGKEMGNLDNGRGVYYCEQERPCPKHRTKLNVTSYHHTDGMFEQIIMDDVESDS